jgi:hypothetical protein
LLFLSLRYGVYDSPTPDTFRRSAPPILDKKQISASRYPRDIKDYRTVDCLSVTLTSEVGWGAIGVVHRGMLDADGLPGFTTLDVVVKLAFESEQKADLKAEYERYRVLRSRGVINGIATTLGLFDALEDGPCALIMLYAGDPLEEEQKQMFSATER